MSVPTFELSNGMAIPALGMGCCCPPDDEIQGRIERALELGYRLFDTAAIYNNERGVGAAIRAAAIPRDQIFLTTKVWNNQQGYDETLAAFEASMGRLGLEYVDLYLIHWPVKERFCETWRAMEKLHREGRIRALGLSNFMPHHLEELLPRAEIRPVMNQVECHPRLPQNDLRAVCAREGIVLEAWSPIYHGKVAEIADLVAIAARHGKTPAQVTLRWHYLRGTVAIPASSKPFRLKENIDIFDFELEPDEIAAIDRAETGQRLGPDPDEIEHLMELEVKP